MRTLLLIAVMIASSLPIFPQDRTPATASQSPALSASNSSSVIVFYRPKRFTGSGLTPSVYVNGEQVARLDNGRYFVMRLSPGTYKIESSMKHDPLQIEVQAGKTEFLEMVILAGNWRGGGRLIPTGGNDGLIAVKKLKPLDPKWVTSEKVSFVVPEGTGSNKAE